MAAWGVAGQQHIGVVTHPKHGEAALASPLRGRFTPAAATGGRGWARLQKLSGVIVPYRRAATRRWTTSSTSPVARG
jgi:hypothetical protein